MIHVLNVGSCFCAEPRHVFSTFFDSALGADKVNVMFNNGSVLVGVSQVLAQ